MKRKLVDVMQAEWSVSQCRACEANQLDPTSYRYNSHRPDQAFLEQRIKEIAATRGHYGYRRLHVMLRREGFCINHKKTHQIYNELGLQLRHKTPKRRAQEKLRDHRWKATRPHQTWGMDFVCDQLATGPKFRTMGKVEDRRRDCCADKSNGLLPKNPNCDKECCLLRTDFESACVDGRSARNEMQGKPRILE